MELVKDDEWGLYPNFTKTEMACSHTGLCLMTHKMMKVLQEIRNHYNKSLSISSGFRDISHPKERLKPLPGEHTFGMAVDIICHGEEALHILQLALDLGVKRIGVSQRGDYKARFLHVGVGDQDHGRFPKGIWTY